MRSRARGRVSARASLGTCGSRRYGSTTRVPAPRVDVPYTARTYVRANAIKYAPKCVCGEMSRAGRTRPHSPAAARSATFRTGEADGCVTRCDGRARSHARIFMREDCAARSRTQTPCEKRHSLTPVGRPFCYARPVRREHLDSRTKPEVAWESLASTAAASDNSAAQQITTTDHPSM